VVDFYILKLIILLNYPSGTILKGFSFWLDLFNIN
jgi:hypothetical protein